MGTSTDGLLFYGWCFDEGHEFPWEDYEEDTWWEKSNGYKPPLELYDERGEYLNGRKPPQAEIMQCYEHKRVWNESHPLPFEVVNYCYCDSPMWAFSIDGTLIRASRGCPEPFDPHQMRADEVLEAGVTKVREFCATHGIELPPGPRWYLASYWG